MQPLARLARGVRDRRPLAAAARVGSLAPLLPEAVDQHGGDREFVDEAVALLLVVDPLGELRIVLPRIDERRGREIRIAIETD